MRAFLFLPLLLLTLRAALAQPGGLIIHPVPAGILYSHHNDDYTVRVRQPGGKWQDLYEYLVQVDPDHVRDASMVTFDTGGPVEVAVRKNNGTARQVRIRPLSYGIRARLADNVAYFTLGGPRKVSVEFDGDKLTNLHLFANPLETEKPDPKDPHVLYFGPGIHTPPDSAKGVVRVPANTTVYLAGGAVLRAKLVVHHADNVRIIGRGIIDQATAGIGVSFSNNVLVEGLIIRNPRYNSVMGAEVRHMTVRNIKSFSAKGWGDGIDFFCSSDVVVDDVFMRNADDCVALYAHRWNYYGSLRNVVVKNSTLWADVAHPTNIGLHGDTSMAGDTLEHIVFQNIDILEHDEDDPDYQGCLNISSGDHNLVRDVRYEDIRIENFEEGRLLNLRVVNYPKYNTGPGRHIENIVFKNIRYTGTLANPSVLEGLPGAGQVRHVRFENVRVNGKLVRSPAAANLEVGQGVTDVEFSR